MSKSYNIRGKRFQRLYKAPALTAAASAESDSATIAAVLCDVRWTETDQKSAVFPLHAGSQVNDEANVNNRELFDAAKFCAEHDTKNGRHRAYAQAACYRFSIPDESVVLQSIDAYVNCDPYTPNGARIAIYTSDSENIPTKCSVCRTGSDDGAQSTTTASDTDGDGVNDTWTSFGKYVSGAAPRTHVESTDRWFAGAGHAVISPQGGMQLKKYLFVFVLLEDYSYTALNGYLEGSAYILPTVSLTVSKAVTKWDTELASGATTVDCSDLGDGVEFPILKGGVPPVVEPSTCLPVRFRDSVVETPFSDNCLPTPDSVLQYNPPGTNSLTIMEEGGDHLTNGTYPWTMSSVFVNDPAGTMVDGFAGGAKQEYGPSQLVYYIRDFFAITYSLEEFPLFNISAYNSFTPRKNLDGSYPILVQGSGTDPGHPHSIGDHSDFMYGKEPSSYEIPDFLGDRPMPYDNHSSEYLRENKVALYSPFCDITHKGALAVGGRLSSIHCAYNKGDVNSPLNEVAPGVRIIVASYSEGSVTHGDNSEYFEFIDCPLIYGKSTIIDTDAYGMLSGGTATAVFVGDPLGPDSSLDVADHTEFFDDSIPDGSDEVYSSGANPKLPEGSAPVYFDLQTNVPNTKAAFLKDLLDSFHCYIGRAYDLDHNDGKPFDADFRILYRQLSVSGAVVYERIDGGYKPDPTMAVTVSIGGLSSHIELNPYDERSGYGERTSRDFFDSGSANWNGTTVNVSQAFLDTIHDPSVCMMTATIRDGLVYPYDVRRYSDDGWQYELWRYAQGGNLIAHFVKLANWSPGSGMSGADMDGDEITLNGTVSSISWGYNSRVDTLGSLSSSMVYPIFVTDGTQTKILAFLRLVTREAPDIVAYPKSSDTNTGAYSLSTVSWANHHNVTMCFMKNFTATYAQLWAPADSVSGVNFGACKFLRYPNMLTSKPRMARYTYNLEEGTIAPIGTLNQNVAPVSWSNNTAAGTCSMTYSGHTASGTGVIYGVCKVPVEFDSYVYLYGRFSSFGGVPCKNVVKVYFTSNGPVAQSLKWDDSITPYGEESEASDDFSSSTDPIRFELAPEAVCGTGPSFSGRLVMYGKFAYVGSVSAPNSIVSIDPTSGEVTSMPDPMKIGFSDKSYLLNADSTSGICAYLNSNGNIAQVSTVTVYPEEIPWSRTVKSDSGTVGIRNCYAKFYEKASFEANAYLSYATGPVFLVGRAKKFTRKWTSTQNGQQIVPGHLPVWRILYAPMCVPYSIPGGTKCSFIDVDWSSIVLSDEAVTSGADDASGVFSSSDESYSSGEVVVGYQYPHGYGATYDNVASTTRFAQCTRGTLINVWMNTKERVLAVPSEVSKDPAFYDGTKTSIGDWTLVGTIDPYSNTRKVSFDISQVESYVGTIALTAWYPSDRIDVTAIGQGFVGSGAASLTSMLHDIPTVGYGFVPDITFRR